MNKYKVYKHLVTVFTLVCLTIFIFDTNKNIEDVVYSFKYILSSSFLICLTISLSIINILLEALKWNYLNNGQYSLGRCIFTTLRAIAYGNSSPAGIGEHAGRIIDSENKEKSFGISIISSIIQTIVISIFGIAAIIILLFFHQKLPISAILISILILLIETTILILLICGNKKIKKYAISVYKSINRNGIHKAALINSFRLIVFSLQISIIIYYGNKSQYFCIIFLYTLLYYLLLTFIPRINILDIGIKGGLAVYIFNNICNSEIVTASIMIIWFVNTLIPSICGFLSLFFKRKSC